MGIVIEAPEEREVTVVAQLLDKQPCPESGLTHYGLVMKYKLVSVVKGSYAETDAAGQLYVIHGAPELPRFVYYKVRRASVRLCPRCCCCCCCSNRRLRATCSTAAP